MAAAGHFELLDARGILRLVTNLVHEDDALFLALTCRALRDALWARFPRRPSRARQRKSNWGNAHMGVRVRTRDAAVVGTVGRLVWARGQLDRPWPEPRFDWSRSDICKIAARYGALASLQWARANGCDWDTNTCSIAAYGGHLACYTGRGRMAATGT
jgi:hypothetical protein